MQRRGFDTCVVVLDDFLVAGQSFTEVIEALNCLIQLLRSLGFRINWNKVVGPTQDIVFLGVRIMTLQNRLHLDPAKESELQSLVNKHLGSTRVSTAQLQTLAGKLGHQHVCDVIRWKLYLMMMMMMMMMIIMIATQFSPILELSLILSSHTICQLPLTCRLSTSVPCCVLNKQEPTSVQCSIYI